VSSDLIQLLSGGLSASAVAIVLGLAIKKLYEDLRKERVRFEEERRGLEERCEKERQAWEERYTIKTETQMAKYHEVLLSMEKVFESIAKRYERKGRGT
jgi:hypothetical protein